MNPAHLETRFECRTPDGGYPVRFGIVTAWNPQDRPADAEANALADAALRNRLVAEGWRHFRVTGTSTDGSHAEPGYAVETESMDEVVELGRWFAQAAVYWVEEDRLYLVDCRVPEPEWIGTWSDRIVPGDPA